MADLTIQFTTEEAAFVLNELHNAGHGHGSTVDDFEGECPSCTAADKIEAALNNKEPKAEGGEGCPMPIFQVTQEERDAIKEIIAGLAFICEISDTGQLVDHAFNDLERRRNASGLPSTDKEKGHG